MLTWPNSLVPVAALLLVLLIAWLAFVRWSRTGPGADPFTCMLWIALRVYARFMHRPTYAGLELVPGSNAPGGLIVVSNHTGPIDPLIIQAVCRFQIHWMMAVDMMMPSLDWLWKQARVIRVARDGRDSGPVREAIRHVKNGGVIGVFPEGAIVRPSGELRPFHDGIGLIISRTRAPVLLVWVTGTPDSPHMGEALSTRSQSRAVFVDLIEFDKGTDPASITRTLRERLAEATGWPVNDEPLTPPNRVTADPFAAT